MELQQKNRRPGLKTERPNSNLTHDTFLELQKSKFPWTLIIFRGTMPVLPPHPWGAATMRIFGDAAHIKPQSGHLRGRSKSFVDRMSSRICDRSQMVTHRRRPRDAGAGRGNGRHASGAGGARVARVGLVPWLIATAALSLGITAVASGQDKMKIMAPLYALPGSELLNPRGDREA